MGFLREGTILTAAIAIVLAAGTGSGCGDDGGAGASFETAPHLLFPQLQPHTGRVLRPLRLVTVAAQNDDLAPQLFAFADALVASNWYSAIGADYGLGMAGASRHVIGPAIASGTTMTNADMVSYITNAIAGGGPQPDGNTVYVLYLPAGAIFYYAPDDGPNTNCRFVGGFHLPYGPGGDAWAAVQRCPNIRTTLLDQLTVTASHEVAESATDTGNGWALSLGNLQPWMADVWLELEGRGHVEAGDLCSGTRIVEGAYTYQRIFSNAAAAAGGDPCVPALPLPYYSTSAPEWTMAAAGQRVTIPVTGWSTAPTADWAVQAFADSRSAFATTPFSVALASATSARFGTTTYPTLDNGAQAMLSVTVPSGTPSGAWQVVAITSAHLTAAGALVDGEDYLHRWLAGVYVP